MSVPQCNPPVARVRPEELKGYMYPWNKVPRQEKKPPFAYLDPLYLFQIKVCILRCPFKALIDSF